MNIDIGNKVIITCDGWFYAPDGQQYRAVFGTLKGSYTTEETLGIKTNSKSTNWYVEIGDVTIAGCQIHYCVRSDTCSKEGMTRWNSDTKDGLVVHDKIPPSEIYFTD